MIGIYKITNPLGQIYVGQSNNILKRFKSHKHKINKVTTLISDSFSNHGYENHIMTVLEECNPEELDNKERYWQDFYDVLNENGLNSVLTKSLDKDSKIRKELSELLSKTWIGRKHTDESKEKQRQAKLGKPMSLALKESLRKANTGRRIGMNSKLYTPMLNIETGVYYDTVGEAAFSINMNKNTLWCIMNTTRQKRNRQSVPFIRA